MEIRKKLYVELLLVLASFLSGVTALLLAVGGYSDKIFLEYLSIPRLMFLNIVPVILMIFLFYGIFGKATAAYGLGSIITLVISLCNYYKLVFRDDPLLFEDILIIREAANMTGSYTLFLNAKIVGIILMSVGTTFLLYKVEKRLEEGSGFKRRAIIILLTVAICSMLYPTYKREDVYTSFQNYRTLNANSQTQIFVSHGFVYPFIHSISQSKDKKPEGYNEKETMAYLATYSDEDIPSEQKVNVFAIMREAYIDFSQYEIDGLDCSGYDLYHQLQEESYTGQLYVNVFAGGTTYTEREFLTGSSNIKNYRSNVNSYPWYFREQGYTVEGSHPFHEWFYNRRNINQYLGFERYRFYEGDYETMTDAYFPEDKYLYSEIYKDFTNNKETGKPYFSFSVNVQSHGPYDITQNKEKEYLIGEQYSDACKHAMNNYMSTILDGDKELIRFVEQLRKDEEPIVLVLFSDHLPWMGDGNIYYKEMGIDFTQDTEEVNKIQYTTEYLIWANDVAKERLKDEFVGKGPIISPCYLMNLLFQRCSWNGPAFMQAMNEVMKTMPVIALSWTFIIDGQFCHGIPQEKLEMYENFSKLQYYWRNKFLYHEYI